jgi:DNA-3-methyladenine glycosylase II
MASAPAWWQSAQRQLAAADPILAAVMRQHSGHLVSRGEPLETLLRAIVGQQISVKAADSVWAKCLTRFAVNGRITPAQVLAQSPEALRRCGLSQSKARYILGIAQGFANGTVHPGQWHAMPDDHIITELTRLPGIGRWTAEMFLMFHLQRPNVLPLDDIGLLKGFVACYGPVRGTAKLTGMARYKKIASAVQRHAARHWQPYNSLATWYLWRSLDPVEVQY